MNGQINIHTLPREKCDLGKREGNSKMCMFISPDLLILPVSTDASGNASLGMRYNAALC
jgi:hypothetical protein